MFCVWVCVSLRVCVQSEVTSCHQALTETRYQRDVVSPCLFQPLLLNAPVCERMCVLVCVCGCVNVCVCVSYFSWDTSWPTPGSLHERHTWKGPRSEPWVMRRQRFTSPEIHYLLQRVDDKHTHTHTHTHAHSHGHTHTHTDGFDITKVELCSFRLLMVQSVNIRVRVKGGDKA